MTSVKAFIRSSSKKGKKITVRLRLTDGRRGQIFYKTALEVLPDDWDKKTELLKARKLIDPRVRKNFNSALLDYKRAFENIYEETYDKSTLKDKNHLNLLIDQRIHPEKYNQTDHEETVKSFGFFEQIHRFLKYKNYPESHRKSFDVLTRLLHRFEVFKQISTNNTFILDLSTINSDLLIDLRDFIFNEYMLIGKQRFQGIYKLFPEHRIIKKRGYNTVIRYMKRLRTFIKWCLVEDLIKKDPFDRFTIGETHDGKPYYINLEERDIIAETDIKAKWDLLSTEEKKHISKHISDHTIIRLIQQRDVFIFQCVVGCRVGDLLSFTPSNINNEVLTYVPHKTKDNILSTKVSVPLNTLAKNIVNRYIGCKDNHGKLLPFISAQRYNNDIKTIFTLCGITREVPVLNAVSGEYEMKPLNEVASSHMARRTFIGNLYRQVKDPNLIGKLSGHVEGSKAFNRYRDIDMSMKMELVSLLDSQHK
jgi:integrase